MSTLMTIGIWNYVGFVRIPIHDSDPLECRGMKDSSIRSSTTGPIRPRDASSATCRRSTKRWRWRSSTIRSVFVLGQGVDDPTAMFGTTKGLQERFGRSRVFDTPLSEEGMMGVSTGAAMNGMRPVFMHNRPDFVLLAFNQLVTHAAKFHFMDNGADDGAAGRLGGDRPRLGIGRAALAGDSRHAARRSRAEDRDAEHARPTPRDCCSRRSSTTTRCASSSIAG